MEIFLSPALAANRKGRFLRGVLHAEILNYESVLALPDQGLLLLEGADLSSQECADELFNWSMQSGCAALVLAPFADNETVLRALPLSLDWKLETVDQVVECDGMVSVIAAEVSQQVLGFVGGAEAVLHKANNTVHTRYIKKHSNSGLFALTTLPLWSVSLLDHADSLTEWLSWFVSHCGEPAQQLDNKLVARQLSPLDYSVLLLASVGKGCSLEEISQKASRLQLFNLEELDLHNRWIDLEEYGYISQSKITELGLDELKKSPYWSYADLLSIQFTREDNL